MPCNEKTVLILGAGASCTYGMPTGAGLRDEFKNENFYNSALDFFSGSRQTENLKPKVREIARNFPFSGCSSIDSWLGIKDNLDCQEAGKLLIAYKISMCQNANALYYSLILENNNIKQMPKKDCWYSLLLNSMDEHHTLESFADHNMNLTIITFNYDITLEYFLYRALKSRYRDKKEKDIWDQVRQLNIIHVYGMAAEQNTEAIPVPYESCKEPLSLFQKSHNLLVIPELRNKRNDRIQAIEFALSQAKHVFFMGFGYDVENMALLNLRYYLSDTEIIMGTCLGMEEGEIAIATKLISNKKTEIQLDKCDCYTFFRRRLVPLFTERIFEP